MARPAVPAVSVFTPSHDPRFLRECYASLLEQTVSSWEWVVVLNGLGREVRGAVEVLGAEAAADMRVRVYHYETRSGVGAAKQAAVDQCVGAVLVELDHDDFLAPRALEAVLEAVEANPEAALVYSHTVPVNADGVPEFVPYAEGHGWEYLADDGVVYPESMPATPHNVSLIWYAPNHLRAFPRWAYDAAGGYDPTLEVLDDQDLMCRLYEVGDFALIPEALYYQRTHAGNTQLARNAAIQTGTWELRAKYFERCALAWAGREELGCLDLGGAHGEPDPRYERMDRVPGPGVDHVHELPNPWWGRTAKHAAGGTYGVIRANDFLEHVADKVALFNELHRLLAPGGILITNTPSTDGRGAWQDPTHVAGYNSNSFWYFTDPAFAGYVEGLTARFQTSRVLDYYPSEFHQAHNIVYVAADLIAVKDGDTGGRQGGPLLW